MKLCDTSSESDLVWDENPDPEGKYCLDFGWEKLNPLDEAIFHRDYLAVEAFSKAFPNAQRVVMAHLNGDFASLIDLNEDLGRRCKEEGLSPEIFCAQLFSDYLHRLASALPEEAIPAVVVDPKKEMNRALLILLFSRRRFEHFQLLFEGKPLPVEGEASTILSLPQDNRFDSTFFTQILEDYPSVKCIPEEFLNEHWDEASEIVYDPETLGELGERMLLGFEAAGGITKKGQVKTQPFRSRGI